MIKLVVLVYLHGKLTAVYRAARTFINFNGSEQCELIAESFANRMNAHAKNFPGYHFKFSCEELQGRAVSWK